MSKEEFIQKLLELWYRCLVDHHKDSDCHFCISENYCAYTPTMWKFEHYGYVNHDDEENIKDFSTYEEAKVYFINFLIKIINKEVTTYLNLPLDEMQYAPQPIAYWYTIKDELSRLIEDTGLYDLH